MTNKNRTKKTGLENQTRGTQTHSDASPDEQVAGYKKIHGDAATPIKSGADRNRKLQKKTPDVNPSRAR